jgi:xanthine/CO dehydrogenase XdhC/CoxF family maturation factor
MNRREAERYLSALAEVRAIGQQAASATVIRVHGSAYRREGARMLVRPDGTYVCSLSGGCLEPAVADAAARVIATGVPSTVTYDLADDSIWSLNIGCSGAVDIRIERIDDDPVTTAWLGALQRGEPAVLVTRLSGADGRRVVFPSGASIGTLGSAALEVVADHASRERLALPYAQSGADTCDGVELFLEVNHAPPELVVFGAGHDAIPLVHHGWTLGFDVTVVDPRAAYLQGDLFPGARLVLTGFDDLASAITLPRGAFVVIMSHHMDRDRLALRFALERDPAYVGVLGPRARYETLLARLKDDGVTPPPGVKDRIHSPVGLALGAESPEEVALSILAEILATRRGFAGGFLSGETGSLHRPALIESRGQTG